MGYYELYHASTRKHKYIKKIGNRYFYTQEEIAAYLNEKKTVDPEIMEAQRRGEKQTSRLRAQQTIKADQDRGRARTEQLKNTSAKQKKKSRGKAKAFLKELFSPPKVGHHTTIKSGGSVTDIHTDSNGKVTKVREGKKSIGHNTTIKTGSDATESTKKKKKIGRQTTMKNLKKQASRGKKALDRIYTKTTSPSVTVTYDEAKLK